MAGSGEDEEVTVCSKNSMMLILHGKLSSL
jgi:hypothetical protein